MRFLAVICVFFVFISGTFSQTKEELQVQKDRAFDEIKIARELMEKTSRERMESVKQLRILQRGINSRANLIGTLEQEVELIEDEIEHVQEDIVKLKKEIDVNREEYARLIYYAYRNHTNYEKLMYILAGESISQSYQRFRYLKYLSQYRKQKVAEIGASLQELDLKDQNLRALKESKLDVLETKDEEQRELEKQRSRKASMVTSLQDQEKSLRKEIKEKERIARELEARIREIIEEEARKVSADNIYAALTPEQELVGQDFQRNKGHLPWPVERGIVTIGYGPYVIPDLRNSNLNNSGIDLDSAPGTTVRSVFEGEVTKVFGLLGANYTVLVRHGEYLTVYNNLINVRVKTGDKVRTKDVLGEAFIDEEDGVARMHFEVWRDRTNLNPEEWLSK